MFFLGLFCLKPSFTSTADYLYAIVGGRLGVSQSKIAKLSWKISGKAKRIGSLQLTTLAQNNGPKITVDLCSIIYRKLRFLVESYIAQF
jgi:hypothetical protein